MFTPSGCKDIMMQRQKVVFLFQSFLVLINDIIIFIHSAITFLSGRLKMFEQKYQFQISIPILFLNCLSLEDQEH